jgi:aryl-alcohol dehydrogenase-like predicted oxidoreductase
MNAYCQRHGVRLLTYGHLLGGFFSPAWLGKPEPKGPFENRSWTKYKLIIDEFGGWDLFQRLLQALQRVGDRHGVGIGEVAVRWTLDRPNVAGCIIGATSTRHLARNVRIFDFALTRGSRRSRWSGRRRASGRLLRIETDQRTACRSYITKTRQTRFASRRVHQRAR